VDNTRRFFISSLLFVLLLGPAARATAGNEMYVGAAEDEARSLDLGTAKAKMDLAAVAGLGTIRMTSTWSPGATTIAGDDLTALQNAAVAAEFDGIRVIVSVYPRDHRTTPLTATARGEFAQYVASIARLVPQIRDFIIGNEPNLNLFWMPQFGASGVDLAAASYELLLAKSYDALKAVSADIDVIGGALSPRGQDKPTAARQTHSPTRFITDLGAAYRRSHRTRPIMDTFAIHPYLIPSRLPPTFTHPNTTTIGLADYPKLVALLTSAFAGTAQPGATLPIIYDEFGYQSEIPKSKRSLYVDLTTHTAADAISEPRQALYYREAIAIAQCQPNVAGMLIFHVTDERDANAWQSGVYYPDGTPKTSMDGVRQAALAADAGVDSACATPKTTNPLAAVTFHVPTTATDALTVDLSCNETCSYALELVAVADGTTAATATGSATSATTISLPIVTLPAGTYEYALRVSSADRPGTGVTRFSTPFELSPAAPDSAEPDPGTSGQPLWPTLLPLDSSLPTLTPTTP
jgi:hypothetical protein